MGRFEMMAKIREMATRLTSMDMMALETLTNVRGEWTLPGLDSEELEHTLVVLERLLVSVREGKEVSA